jgi:acyl carrier protein
MEELLQMLAETLELQQVDDTYSLRENELWDSLSVLSVLAFIDERFGVSIESIELADVGTPKDLYELILKKN